MCSGFVKSKLTFDDLGHPCVVMGGFKWTSRVVRQWTHPVPNGLGRAEYVLLDYVIIGVISWRAILQTVQVYAGPRLGCAIT